MSSIFRIRVVLAAIILAGVAPARGQSPTPAPAVPAADPANPDQWRNIRRCGINATYVFLGLQGIKVDYDRVLHRIGVGERGSTLKDLRDATTEAGLPAVVAKTTLEGLARAPLPLIAHMEAQDAGEFAHDRRGHYIVVLSVNDRMVRYIDGSTGRLTFTPRLDFAREWTGYVLVAAARPSESWARRGWLGAAVAGLCSAAAWGALFLWRRPAANPGVALAIVLIAAASGAAQASDSFKDRPVPTAAEVRAAIEAQRARTPALWVTYATKQTALADPATLQKYLNKIYLRNDRSEDAFKGPKRFHKVNQPEEVDSIAPPAPPVVDPDAPPATRENQERLRKQYEENAARASKSTRSARSERLGFQPQEAWAYNGNGLDLKRLVPGLAEIYDYRRNGSMMAFQSSYFFNVGWEPPDPTMRPEVKENRAAMSLPGIFDRFRHEARPAPEMLKDGSACVVLSGRGSMAGVETIDTLWFDLDHGLMLRRHEMALPGDAMVRTLFVAEDPQEVPGATGIFLPRRCRFFECAPVHAPGSLRSKPLAQTEMTVLECKANDLVPDSLFELPAPPGTLVEDYRKGADLGLKPGYPLEFTAPADAAELDRAIDHARRLATSSGTSAQPDRRRWFLWLNLAAVAVVVLVVAVRRLLRRMPRPPRGSKP